MVFDILDVVCCPNCKGDLENLNIADSRGGITFSCRSCNSEFRKKEEILILINKELEDELRG